MCLVIIILLACKYETTFQHGSNACFVFLYVDVVWMSRDQSNHIIGLDFADGLL